MKQSVPLLLRFDLIRDHPDDLTALLALKSTTADVLWSGHGDAPDPALFADWYARQLVRDDRRIWLARTIGAAPEVAGYLYVTVEEGAVRISHGAHPDQGGRGIGTMIVNFAANFCLACHAPLPVEAWVAETNPASLKTFARNGFADTGISQPRFNAAAGQDLTMRCLRLPRP